MNPKWLLDIEHANHHEPPRAPWAPGPWGPQGGRFARATPASEGSYGLRQISLELYIRWISVLSW